ncbi:MAG: hypothetical protein Aurels2KO_32440 [Aureliella sp.]
MTSEEINLRGGDSHRAATQRPKSGLRNFVPTNIGGFEAEIHSRPLLVRLAATILKVLANNQTQENIDATPLKRWKAPRTFSDPNDHFDRHRTRR